MNKDEWYIYPLIRKTVGKLASACAVMLLLSALSAATELLLLNSGALLPGLVCGLCSELMFALALCGWCLLHAWGHRVLLACGGVPGTWFLSHLAAIFSIIMAGCAVYSTLSGQPTELNYPAIPLLICPLLLIDIAVNFNNMAALSLGRRLLLPLVVIAVLGVTLTAHPALLVINIALKIALAATAAPLLRSLAQLAPQIISLPETE